MNYYNSNDECFECYVHNGSNNYCGFASYHEGTCLECVNNICGSNATTPITDALRSFSWIPIGTCTQCKDSGITINILLCRDHSTQRSIVYESSDYEFKDNHECFLCDYEGKSWEEEGNVYDIRKYCDNCRNEICHSKEHPNRYRKNGSIKNWVGAKLSGECYKCGIKTSVEELTLCCEHF